MAFREPSSPEVHHMCTNSGQQQLDAITHKKLHHEVCFKCGGILPEQRRAPVHEKREELWKNWQAAHSFDHDPDESRLQACQTKSHIAEVAKMVSKKATEVHGGMGFTDLLGLHYWFKRIGVNRQILGGPELVREEAAELQGFNQ